MNRFLRANTFYRRNHVNINKFCHRTCFIGSLIRNKLYSTKSIIGSSAMVFLTTIPLINKKEDDEYKKYQNQLSQNNQNETELTEDDKKFIDTNLDSVTTDELEKLKIL